MISFKQFILISFVFLTLLGCRKGENDPLFSLRTRKARITGVWKLQSGTYSYDSPGTYNLEVEYDGANATERLNGTVKNSYPFTISFTINKDFTFERVTDENRFRKIEKGSWFFNKKSKKLDLKNKEAIVLSISSIESSGKTTTFGGARADEILIIDMLKNDELIFKAENTFTSSKIETEKYEMNYLKF